MRRLLLSLALLGLPWSILAKDCKVHVHKHERHTTEAQKRQAYANAGIKWEDRHKGKCKDGCVVDHIVSLEIGGTDTVGNMQIQTVPDGKAKDLREGFLARCVCSGETPLKKAQAAILRWKSLDMKHCP